MIPSILHQTWKTDQIPERFQPWVDSWAKYNPGWTRMFWNDRTLLDFVGQHYPDFLDTFCSYPAGIFRADAGRYLLLHHFGGVYADLDCECVAPFDPIMSEDRIVLCTEPKEHEAAQIYQRGLPHLLFNGTIASPAKHPFWNHVVDCMLHSAHSGEVLDATGPCLLTSAHMSYPDQRSLVVYPPKLFAPLDHDGKLDSSPANEAVQSLSVHHWAATWVGKPSGREVVAVRQETVLSRQILSDARRPERRAGTAGQDRSRDHPQSRPGGREHRHTGSLTRLSTARFSNLVASLDYPSERIKLVFCEGDSKDDSWERLQAAVVPVRARYRDIVLLQKGLGTKLDRVKRHKPRFQRERRSGLAKIRNHIVRHGLDESDDWALWIDIDVWKFPPDILQTLLSTGNRIVTPNCVKVTGGPSFDRNNFLTIWVKKDYQYYRSVKDGLYQPPSDFWGRLHLPTCAISTRSKCTASEAPCFRSTRLCIARACSSRKSPTRIWSKQRVLAFWRAMSGVPAVGLPKVEIFHVPW